MDENNFVKDMMVEGTKVIVKEVYDDVAKPALKSIGSIIAFPFQAIDSALSHLKAWFDNGKNNYDKTRNLLAEKLKNVDESKIVEPEAYVAVPAIQQLAYSFDSEELRNMYANLLATSMNADRKWDVHPAFSGIIGQLCPDEAKLLKSISCQSDQPLIDINLVSENDGSYKKVIKNFTDISEEACDNPDGIFSYLDNLERLKIIKIFEDIHLKDESKYEKLKTHPEIVGIMSQTTENGWKYEIKKKKFELTSFGQDFIDVCLKD